MPKTLRLEGRLGSCVPFSQRKVPFFSKKCHFTFLSKACPKILEYALAIMYHLETVRVYFYLRLDTFKQVARTVAGVELRDHLVDVVFCIFDENGTNYLFSMTGTYLMCCSFNFTLKQQKNLYLLY